MNKSAIAHRSFMRSDTKMHVRPGDQIQGSARYIDDLARIGLVRQVGAVLNAPENKANPSPAAGNPLSASQAAPASQPQTLNPSGDGAKKRGRPKKEA